MLRTVKRANTPCDVIEVTELYAIAILHYYIDIIPYMDYVVKLNLFPYYETLLVRFVIIELSLYHSS